MAAARWVDTVDTYMKPTDMVRYLVSVILAALVASSLGAPGERFRRHYDGGLGGYGGGGGGGGGGGFGGYPAHGGHGGFGGHYPLGGGAAQSFSKSQASASSSSVSGGLGG